VEYSHLSRDRVSDPQLVLDVIPLVTPAANDWSMHSIAPECRGGVAALTAHPAPDRATHTAQRPAAIGDLESAASWPPNMPTHRYADYAH
jgi:hypothetical protein